MSDDNCICYGRGTCICGKRSSMAADELAAVIQHARSWLEDPGAPDPGTNEVDDIATLFARAIVALDDNATRMREYRFALEGVPTDGHGNPLPSKP